ncbi:MAG: hypothetical protein RL540_401, partial [Actinomycetota bacterium]
ILAFHEFEGVLLNPTITGQPFKVMSHQECAKKSGTARVNAQRGATRALLDEPEKRSGHASIVEIAAFFN